MKRVSDLKVKIFADGADKAGMLEMYSKPYIRGFTTNPTLMRKAGVSDYRAFGKDILQAIPDRPISLKPSRMNLSKWSARLLKWPVGEGRCT